MDRLQERSGFLPGLTSSLKHFKKSNTKQNQSTSQEKSRASTDQPSTITDEMKPAPSPLFHRVPNRIRNHFIASVAEFVGTFLFLFLAFAGTQVANTPTTSSGNDTTLPQGPNPQVLMYISLVFGFSLAVNAWVFYRISGGLFNPAVTLALCLIGAVPFGRGFFCFISQMLGAMAAAGVVKALFPGPLAVTTSLGGGASKSQGLFIEMFLTAVLVFTIIMLAAEKHKATFIAPIGIGLALFVSELAGVYYTGGSLNPARSFGPCVANKSFPSEHWIYWLGPFLGALLASAFYWFIKSAEYETANPGQDFDDLEAGVYNPEADGTRPVVQPNAEAPPERPFSEDVEDRSSSTQPLSPERSIRKTGSR